MIDITPYERKLKALELYMDMWLAEKHCIIKWWDHFNDTGIVAHRYEWLPSFEEWYKERCKNELNY